MPGRGGMEAGGAATSWSRLGLVSEWVDRSTRTGVADRRRDGECGHSAVESGVCRSSARDADAVMLLVNGARRLRLRLRLVPWLLVRAGGRETMR
jgi:hypothetical protein